MRNCSQKDNIFKIEMINYTGKHLLIQSTPNIRLKPVTNMVNIPNNRFEYLKSGFEYLNEGEAFIDYFLP